LKGGINVITPGLVFGIVVIIIVMAIVIPVAVVLGKSVYNFLGGDTVGIKPNRELCERLKLNIISFTSLHMKIKEDMRSCNIADDKLLRKEFGNDAINAFVGTTRP
jgi:hypothetical protein